MRLIDGDELEKRLREQACSAEVQSIGLYRAIKEIREMPEYSNGDIVYCSDCRFRDSENGCVINRAMIDYQISEEYLYCGLAVKK